MARGGPGLWVAAGGSAAAFATLFLPPSSQATLRRPAATGPALAWAADRDAAGRRRGLQIALGLMWLLDAALQYQPYMFSRNFVTTVLEPASMGNPALLAGPAAATARIIAHDVVAWNAAFATIQLALAAGLLSFVLAGAGVVWGATARPALVLAVLIAMFIWVAGEDFGGVLTGHATDPGSGPLLILLAAAFWPQRRAPSPGQPRRGGDLSARTVSGSAAQAAGPPMTAILARLRRPQPAPCPPPAAVSHTAIGDSR